MNFLRRLFASKKTEPPGKPLRLEGQVLGMKAAGKEGGPAEMEVLIARPGYSRDGGRFLPEGVLAAAAPRFEEAQCFANHAEQGPPDVRCLTGWHRNARMGEHEGERALLSTLLVSSAAKWLQDLAADALAAGIKEPFGFSYDMMARAHLEEQEGRGLVQVVDEITKVNSVDVVFRGRHGGMPLALAADDSPDKEIAMLEKLLAWLKENAPNRHEALGKEFTLERVLQACEESGFDPGKMQAQAEDEPPESGAGIPGPAAGSAEPPARKAGGDSAATLKAAAKSGADDPGVERRLAAIERGQVLDSRLKACALPDPVKDKLRAQYDPKRLWEEKDLAEAIQLEAKTLEKLTASGALRGYGARAEVTQDEADRVQGMMDGMVDPKAKISSGARPFRFLSEAWPAYSREPFEPRRVLAACREYGRRASTDFGAIQRLRASLTLAGWGQAFGDSITRALMRDYREDIFNEWTKVVSSKVPLKDFRTKRAVRLGGYGNLATVAEQATYPALTTPTDEEATYAPAKRGGIEDLTLETIQNDDIGAIQAIPKRLSRAAKATLNSFVFVTNISANPTLYDGTALFAAGHGGNTAASALTYANLVTGIEAMMQQTFYNEPREVGAQARPRFLLHPSELSEEAFDLLANTVKVVTGQDATMKNWPNALGIEAILVPEYTDANDWFLVADPRLMDTIEIGFLDGQEEPELFVEDNESAGSPFNADKLRYKIRHIYGGAVLDFRGFYRGAPA
ncbi:MAG: hypothetical protein HY618_00930 [Candidatus Tectomicrobia bacterium]|uniref:Bacteriophage Mu GpT domain-containing protein n=1 Tax=Tectimicrobiota bacterium TaxID=2528274 RepID=A0A932ZST3_UNCTE|nr:hypothetical protein [Candidatus Tectomicrobia bacterium]